MEESNSRDAWPVPPLLYHHVGTRILLLTRLDGKQARLKAFEVPGDIFRQLLFCRISVHRRAYYADHMQRLEAGELAS